NVSLFGANESPNLIDLDALTSQVVENPVLVPGGCLAGIDHELADRLLAGGGEAAMVRSPVEICLGIRPNHAAKSRPLENASPVPIAATMALERHGPMPGTLISRSHPASCRAKTAISLDN